MIIPTLYEMETSIAKHWGTRAHMIVPNVSFGLGLHECDLLIVTKSNYAIEVEIKRSKADLKKDAEKKHGHASNKIKELWFAIPENLKECTGLIPDNAGILVVYRYKKTYYWQPGIAVSILREPSKNKGCVALTDKERMKLGELAAMRIWNLKSKIIELKNSKQTELAI